MPRNNRLVAGKLSHVGVTSSCQACHNGVTALSKSAQHPITARDCGNLPQYVELDHLDSCAQAASVAQSHGREHRSDEVNAAGIRLQDAMGSRRSPEVADGFIWPVGSLAPASAPIGVSAGPMVKFIDTQELEDHADISIEFACSVRYVTNVPASHGESNENYAAARPDCGPQLSAVTRSCPWSAAAASCDRRTR